MLLNFGVREDSWVPWTTWRSNQSILKEISPDYSLEYPSRDTHNTSEFFHRYWNPNKWKMLAFFIPEKITIWQPQEVHRETTWGQIKDMLALHTSWSSSAKVKMKMKLLSGVWLFVTPWTVAYQAPPSKGFSRQEFCSGLSFPSPGDFPGPGIEPGSPAL